MTRMKCVHAQIVSDRRPFIMRAKAPHDFTSWKHFGPHMGACYFLFAGGGVCGIWLAGRSGVTLPAPVGAEVSTDVGRLVPVVWFVGVTGLSGVTRPRVSVGRNTFACFTGASHLFTTAKITRS